MSPRNSQYIDAVKAYERVVPKLKYAMESEQAVNFILRLYERLRGGPLTSADKIVDFGCGAADTTVYLNERGFDAHGVDILEYWGENGDLYGGLADPVPAEMLGKLHVINPETNTLPFEDGSISLLFSDQTLEHIFDYRPVFAEQARVLKPGGVAIHRFPHGYTRIEPHTKAPFTALNKYDAYLALWALLGRRNWRQTGMNWREALDSNRKVFATTNYVPRSVILAATQGLGVTAEIGDFIELATGRAGALYHKAAAFGLGPLAKAILARLQDNQILVLRKPA